MAHEAITVIVYLLSSSSSLSQATYTLINLNQLKQATNISTMSWSQLNPSYHLDQLAASAGLESGILKQIVCLFLSFPFAAILKRLPDHNILLKNIYIISVSSLYLFAIMNLFSGFFTLFVATMVTYCITRYVRSPYMPWINFVFTMAHLATNHLKAQFFNTGPYDPNAIDITGAQMVLVMKLTSFGWSVQDGRTPSKELTSHQRAKIVKKHPNLINFISFAFFFPSLLTGPSFDYADYDKWIHGELFVDVPESKKPGRKRKRLIPKNGRVAFWKALQGIIWAVLWLKAAQYISVQDIFTVRFARFSFVTKAVLLYVLGVTYRLKYYAAWSISEASCISSGLGYNGYDKETGKFKWNAVQNIDPIAFETGQNAHVCLEAWNMNTNKWLKNYVYLRVKRKNKKPGFKSTLFTFVVSAFWHGTRPGYYMSFVCGALFQTAMKIYRKNIRPIFLGSKQRKLSYDVVTFIVTQLSFGFMAQPFIILDFPRSWYCWKLVYFYPLVGVTATIAIFRGPYSKQVVNLLKSYHYVEPVKEAGHPTGVAGPQPPAELKSAKLAKILKDKEAYEEYGTLGVPNADFSKEEFEQSLKEASELAQDFKEWKEHNDGQVVMKDALDQFRNEMMSLVDDKGHKKEIKKKD